MSIDEINALERRIFQKEAEIAFLKAQQLRKLPQLIAQLEMLSDPDGDDEALIDWLRSFLPWAAADDD